MQVEREHDRIRLKANPLEAQLLEQVLRLVMKHYELKPSELDPRISGTWYSTRGCKAGGMTEEETADWVDSLHSLKSAQLCRLNEWAAKLAGRQSPPVLLELTFAEASSLITILNDYRLLIAARNNIGQREMDLHSRNALKELPEAQQSAIYHIEVVAWIMDGLLRFVAPEASRWMETAEE